MNRQERRKEISPFILHSKSFKKAVETILEDGSISFNVEWYASTVEKDWSGDIVVPSWIDVSRYMKNPILKMWHTRWEEFNVWLVDNITTDDYWMFIKWHVVLNPTIEKHKEWIHWLRHNLINWFSIWFWDVVQHFDAEKDANIIDSLKLYEISLVDIPDNPMTIRKALSLYAQKSVIPFSKTPTADKELERDGAGAKNRLKEWATDSEWNIDFKKYQKWFAWYDKENEETLWAYKLPHHDIIDWELKVVWRWVVAAMSALMWWRWWTNIPDDELKWTYNHLSKHYEQFDETPPDFKEKSIEQITDERTKEFELVRNEVFAKFNECTNMWYKELLRWSETECSKLWWTDRSPIERALRLKEKAKDSWVEKDVTDAWIVTASISALKWKIGKWLLMDSQWNTCWTKARVMLKNCWYDHWKTWTIKTFNTKNTNMKKMLLNSQQIQVWMIIEYEFKEEYCYSDNSFVGVITNIITSWSVVCWWEWVIATQDDPVVVINRVIVWELEVIPTSIYDTVKLSNMEIYSTDTTWKDLSKLSVKTSDDVVSEWTEETTEDSKESTEEVIETPAPEEGTGEENTEKTIDETEWGDVEKTQESEESWNAPANPEQGEWEEGTKNADLIQVIVDLKEIVIWLCQRVNTIDDRTKNLWNIVKDAPLVYNHIENENEVKAKSKIELDLEKAQKQVRSKFKK